ncbi:MAG: hypothetical protein KGL39_24755 [Patescibacteria group bacterium]|nr:hypothetical protein [Patescibacteria group bacterium]
MTDPYRSAAKVEEADIALEVERAPLGPVETLMWADVTNQLRTPVVILLGLDFMFQLMVSVGRHLDLKYPKLILSSGSAPVVGRPEIKSEAGCIVYQDGHTEWVELEDANK